MQNVTNENKPLSSWNHQHMRCPSKIQCQCYNKNSASSTKASIVLTKSIYRAPHIWYSSTSSRRLVNSTNKAKRNEIKLSEREKKCAVAKCWKFKTSTIWMEFGVDEDENRNNNRLYWIPMIGIFSIENVSDVVYFAIQKNWLQFK